MAVRERRRRGLKIRVPSFIITVIQGTTVGLLFVEHLRAPTWLTGTGYDN